MEKIKCVILSILAVVMSMFSTVVAQSSSDAYQTETFSVENSPSVLINTSGGHIDVVGHSDNEVRVEMYVRKGNRYYSVSDTDLDDYEITIEKQGNTVTASAKKENSSSFGGWFRSGDNFSIAFKVFTPESSLVEARTSGGHISAENLQNDLSARTSGGHVSVDRIVGTMDLRTSGGHIEILNSSGNTDARTSGGHINAENTQGELNLRTSGGHITLEEVQGAVSGRTSGGSITANLLEITGDLDLRTSGGSIRISVPDEAGYDLNLRGNRVNVKLQNFTGDSERGRILGKMNGGGHSIQARTSGGSVNVDFS
ncbi:MAG: DUF4097 family beta strand repeat-containing protein [Balneolaceae bacterium]